MGDYWRVEILVDDEIIRRYHELEAEDPKADQTLVSDWISDLVIDARKAHEHGQKNPGPDCAAAAELRYGRADSQYVRDGNFVFVRATRVDYNNAANAASGADEDEPRPETD